MKSDLRAYVKKRKARSPAFAENYEAGYEDLKIGIQLSQLRKKEGMTQETLAKKLHTKKSAISRLERHGDDVRLSTLVKIASALGRKVRIVFSKA